jgi:hypothetical protein
MDLIWFADKAWFHLSGYMNSQNTPLWESENPHAIHEDPLYCVKTGVLHTISQTQITGPIFFDCSVNKEVFLTIFKASVYQMAD